MNGAHALKPLEAYEQFFGLIDPPFGLAPNPRFVFQSASHSAALDELAYAIVRREPVVVVTGEIGAGKTLLCRTLLQRIPRQTFVSVVDDPQLERDDLLKHLLRDFGVISNERDQPAPTSRHELFDTLRAFLTSLIPLKAHAVVIIDEAQHLQPQVIEQIRLLSNLDDGRGTLLQIVLVGQTDLEPLLSRPELGQFQQRVTRRLRLEPLGGGEVKGYIDHRLLVACGGTAWPIEAGASELEQEVAGWAQPKTRVVFEPEAIVAISKISGGLPRVINVVCDRALEEAHTHQLRTVDLQVINSAARALGLAVQPSPAAEQRVAAPVRESIDAAKPGPSSSIEPAAPVRPATPQRPRQSAGSRAVPITFGAVAQTDETPRWKRWFAIVAPLALLAALVWFAAR